MSRRGGGFLFGLVAVLIAAPEARAAEAGPRSGAEVWDVACAACHGADGAGRSRAELGFDVRVPAMSRRKATPMLRLFAESSDTVVGAHQLSNVSWSVLLDDVELQAIRAERLAWLRG